MSVSGSKATSLVRGKRKWNARTDPPPDLAVEIDITTSWLDRLEIYAALEVPEVWRFDRETLKVLVLAANGKYKERTGVRRFRHCRWIGSFNL